MSSSWRYNACHQYRRQGLEPSLRKNCLCALCSSVQLTVDALTLDYAYRIDGKCHNESVCIVRKKTRLVRHALPDVHAHSLISNQLRTRGETSIAHPQWWSSSTSTYVGAAVPFSSVCQLHMYVSFKPFDDRCSRSHLHTHTHTILDLLKRRRPACLHLPVAYYTQALIHRVDVLAGPRLPWQKWSL